LNYVDLWAPKIAGATIYRLKWASAFGLGPAAIIESTNSGYLDPNVNFMTVNPEPINNGIRMVFNPESYGIPDRESFWVQLVPVVGGVETNAGAMTLVLPAHVRNGSACTIVGTPIGTQQIDLPALQDVKFVNGAPIEVGLEDGGAMWTVPQTSGAPYSMSGLVTSLYVKGGQFSMTGLVAR
jgi:hypothetical protein